LVAGLRCAAAPKAFGAKAAFLSVVAIVLLMVFCRFGWQSRAGQIKNPRFCQPWVLVKTGFSFDKRQRHRR
jgi:hypothetical protein